MLDFFALTKQKIILFLLGHWEVLLILDSILLEKLHYS